METKNLKNIHLFFLGYAFCFLVHIIFLSGNFESLHQFPHLVTSNPQLKHDLDYKKCNKKFPNFLIFVFKCMEIVHWLKSGS